MIQFFFFNFLFLVVSDYLTIYIWQRHTHVRMFSSTTHFSSKPAYPFLLIDYILNIPDSSPDGRVTIDVSSKEKLVCINDEKLIQEVCDVMTVGFSRDGLHFHLSYSKDKPVISYHPSNPKLEDVKVHLPALPTGSEIQNLAMSSLPVREKDWVVGVKLSGSRLSLCRPFGSSKWININTMPQCINALSSSCSPRQIKGSTFQVLEAITCVTWISTLRRMTNPTSWTWNLTIFQSLCFKSWRTCVHVLGQTILWSHPPANFSSSSAIVSN